MHERADADGVHWFVAVEIQLRECFFQMVEDSFRRWNGPGGEVNLAVVTALKTWTEKVRHGP